MPLKSQKSNHQAVLTKVFIAHFIEWLDCRLKIAYLILQAISSSKIQDQQLIRGNKIT
jgi:hypothetical protein